MALSSLTVEFEWQTGFPVYHTWFATQLRAVAGTVTLDGTTPQAGVEITLTGPSGEVVATTTTGDDGTYAFDGIAPGEYEVTMTVPDGLTAVGPEELPAVGAVLAETTTDEDGDFVLPDVPAGDYELIITPPGGAPIEIPVTVRSRSRWRSRTTRRRRPRPRHARRRRCGVLALRLRVTE